MSEATVGHIIGFLRLDADQFHRELLKADKEADALGRKKVNVKATADTGKATGELERLKRAADGVDGANKRVEKSTNSLGRSQMGARRNMRALTMAVLTLGPALAPLFGTTIGLAGAFGGMGAAGVLAILGIRREMEAGTSLGKQYSGMLKTAKSNLDQLSTTAATGVLKPFRDIVVGLQDDLPDINRGVAIMSNLLGSGSGNLVTGVVASLRTLGPLLVDAGVWVDNLLAKFAQAASGGGLQEFVDYARATLPLVTSTLEALVVAAVDLVRAFAPMGAGVLAVIRDISQAISAMPAPVLLLLASGASAAFLGFQSWKGITRIVDGVVGALQFMNTKMVVSASLARGLSIATAGVGAAIGVATFLYSRHAAAAAEAEGRVNGLTDALQRSNGAIDENIRQTAFKTLQDQGAIAAARDLGLNLADVTSAALGQVGAQERLNTQITFLRDGMRDTVNKTGDAGMAYDDFNGKVAQVQRSIGTQNGEMQEAIRNWNDHKAAMASSAPVADAETAALNRQAAMFGTTGAALKAATEAQKTQADSARAATLKMQLESDAAGLLKQKLDALNGETLTAAQAQNQFDSALANMSDHTTKTGKKVVLTTKNMHGMSAASVAIRGDLIGQVQAMEAVAEANGGVANSTGKGIAQLKAMRQQIIDNAVAHGHNRKAVIEFVDSLFKIPKSVPPTKADLDKREADRKIQALKTRLDVLARRKTVEVWADTRSALRSINNLKLLITGLSGKTVTVNTRYVYTGRLQNGGKSTAGGQTLDDNASANGNIFKAYANGGVESHVAQMAPAGAMRLWAEPETGGESYIPHAKSKRARSLAIWEETGRILGANQTTTNHSPVYVDKVVAADVADFERQVQERRRKKALGRRRAGV